MTDPIDYSRPVGWWCKATKHDYPLEDWQAWANGSCPEPGCSLANPHEQGVACVKPTAEGGEG